LVIQKYHAVALFTGAWIEMAGNMYILSNIILSRSLRARGLKFHCLGLIIKKSLVALFTGAWIEIAKVKRIYNVITVALFTGAWIEIFIVFGSMVRKDVALFTGAWIEMSKLSSLDFKSLSRALYGRVD